MQKAKQGRRDGMRRDGNSRSKQVHTTDTIWLYGRHAVLAALANPKRVIKQLYATRNQAALIKEQYGVDAEVCDAQNLERFVPGDAVHQGVVAHVEVLESPALEEVADGRPIVMLDQVSDPHNAGAILRSAAAFNAAAVVVTRHHGVRESGALARAACGALDIVPLVTVANLADALLQLRDLNYWSIGLDGEAERTLAESPLDGRLALVLGAEGAGMRRLTRERCDMLAKLPIHPQMESLNVSNAAAIALYALAVRIGS